MKVEKADHIIEVIKKLADEIINDYKKETEELLTKIYSENQLKHLRSEYDKYVGNLTDMWPHLRNEDNFLKKKLIADSLPDAIEESFRIWHRLFINIREKHRPFYSKVKKHEFFNHPDIWEQEHHYNRTRSLCLTDENFNLQGSYFYYLVYSVPLIFPYYVAGVIDFVDQKIDNLASPISGPGLNCSIDIEGKKKLFKFCINEALISEDTRQDDFIAALSPTDLPPSFKPVKWIKRNKNLDPHQETVGALIDVARGKVTRKIIRKVIVDNDGSPFKLGKLNRKDMYYEQWIEKFEDVLK